MAGTSVSAASSLCIPYSSRKYIDEIPVEKRTKLCTEIDYTIHLNQGYWQKLVSGLGYDETHSKKFRLSFEMHESPTDNLLRDCSFRMLRIRHLYHVLMDIGLAQLALDVLQDFDTEEDLPQHLSTPFMPAYPPRTNGASHFEQAIEKKSKVGSSEEWHGLNTKHFSYEEIKLGTHGFHPQMELGAGAFGKVYKVILNKTVFACKVLKIDKDNPLTTSIIETHRQHDDLRNELNYLAEYRHPNVIALYGWSLDGPDPCLIYDYMMNGSLQDRLQCLNESPSMDWDKRVKVSCGAARGLQFLHTNNKKPLIHGDIKTANILLDESFTAKLGDFGLAREMPRNASTGSYIQLRNEHTPGTLGYLANEYITTKKLSVQVDTYAFGVVLLELYTGRRAYDRSKETYLLRDYMHDIANEAEEIGEERASDKLFKLQDPQIKQLERSLALRFVRLSLQCCHEKRTKRPRMADALAELEKIDLAMAKLNGRESDSVKFEAVKSTTNGPDLHRRKGTSRHPVESVDHHSLLPDMTASKADRKVKEKFPERSIEGTFDQMRIHRSSGDDSDSMGPSSEPTTYSNAYIFPRDCPDQSSQPSQHHHHSPYYQPTPPNYPLHMPQDYYPSTVPSEEISTYGGDIYAAGPCSCPGGSRVTKSNPYGLDLTKAPKPQCVCDDPPLVASSSSHWPSHVHESVSSSYNSGLDYMGQSITDREDLTLPTTSVYGNKGSAMGDESSPSEATYPHALSFQFHSPVSVNPLKESLIEQLGEGKSYTEIFNDSSRIPIESSVTDS